MGKRTGNPRGRPVGAKSKRTKEREEAMEEAAEHITAVLGPNAFDGDAHALLIALYKDTQQPLLIRLDAAKAAISYEKPRLSAVDANLGGTLGTYAAQPIPTEQRHTDAVARPNGSAANGHSA